MMDNHNAATGLLCIGLSHQTSSVQQREYLAGASDAWIANCLRACPDATEWALLSTCNRIELYLAMQHPACEALLTLQRCTAEVTGLGETELGDILYTGSGLDAARHLLTVAAGLDSMVLGESQILGQVTSAYRRAVERAPRGLPPLGAVGPALNALFRAAIRAGKRVRTETAVGRNPASVGSVALDLAESQLGDLRSRRVTVVGLGEMGGIALKLLQARGVHQVSVVNRTLARAEAAAGSPLGANWMAYSLDNIQAAISHADLILTATGAPHPVITREMLIPAVHSRRLEAGALWARAGHAIEPLVVIDMALPRDVDLGGAALSGLTLYDLDDLQGRVADARTHRELALEVARQIIGEELVQLQSDLRELAIRPLVVELRQRAESIREQELQRTLRFLGDVDPETRAHLQHLTRALVNKLLHQPTVRIKKMAHEKSPDDYVAAVCELFGLDDPASHL